uniref:VOC family protein n=1 Tax=Phytobacter sp. V91 TaxID=3369425 RepID=UPI003F5FA215
QIRATDLKVKPFGVPRQSRGFTGLNYFAYLHVTNASELHDEWAGRGADILSPLTDQPHGMREFMIATPDGHRIMIGQALD